MSRNVVVVAATRRVAPARPFGQFYVVLSPAMALAWLVHL